MVYACGDKLAAQKQRIAIYCRDLGATPEQTYIILAIAMAETTDCCASQRDASKDNTPSANYSCFNMNLDMLTMLGWTPGQPDLNDEAHLKDAIGYILLADKTWGMDRFLSFHRGGRTAFDDGVSYGAQEYKDAIHQVAQYLKVYVADQMNHMRVAFDVPHV